MISQYKDVNQSFFLTSMKHIKTPQGKCDLDEETIFHYQSVFLTLNSIVPKVIDDEAKEIFSEIDRIIQDKKCLDSLPTLVPYSVYPQLVLFLTELVDNDAHELISKIISGLTYDVTNSLEELLKYDIMKALETNMNFFLFRYSTDHLFQIIANFIHDPSEDISMAAHQTFPIDYLFRIFQYVKNSLKPELKSDLNPNSQLRLLSNRIANKWMRCIYATIDKYPKDIIESEATIVLIEIKKYFDVVQNDLLLCRFLCFSISTLIDENLINFSDFNQYEYPSFLHFLAQYEDQEVKAYAYSVIAKLISINRFNVSCKFEDFFQAITDGNEDTSPKLITATLYMCSCFLDNDITTSDTFNTITENIQFFFDLYETSDYLIKEHLHNLFVNYMVHFSDLDESAFPELESIISTIVNYLFDFIQTSDDDNQITNLIHAFLSLNKYLIATGHINSPSLEEYKSNFVECIEYFHQSENNEIDKLADIMEKSMTGEIDELD